MKKEQNFENLEQLLEKIKTIGFFERIFSWNKIRELSYEAYKEFSLIEKTIEIDLKKAVEKIEVEKTELQSEIKPLYIQDKDNTKKIVFELMLFF